MPIVLFHNYFPFSGEQPEHRMLAHKTEQATADMSKYHNAGT